MLFTFALNENKKRIKRICVDSFHATNKTETNKMPDIGRIGLSTTLTQRICKLSDDNNNNFVHKFQLD